MDVSSLFPPDVVRRLRRQLVRWHGRHARRLPWRETGDPYGVWISEIMLQQTTVAAVVPYYERFLARFPDVHALASADEADVLRAWEGLGYYSRARNIHQTARLLVERYGAALPRDVATLVILPGIGRYTAGAIVSFAYDMPAPIVEANTLRLYCRLLGFDGDPRSSVGQNLLWAFAEHVLPRERAGRFNQALMDLGATVCVPAVPECPHCPLKSCCRAFQMGLQNEIPRPPRPIPTTFVTEATIAVHKQGAYLLRRRGESERWAGLWDFPRFELANGNSHPPETNGQVPLAAEQARWLAEQVGELTGIRIGNLAALTTLTHSVTRYRITLRCLHADYASGRLRRAGTPLRWVRPTDFDQFPLSVTGRKLARLLEERGCGIHSTRDAGRVE